MKKRAFTVLLVAMVAALAFTFAGCANLPIIKTYAVTYSAGEGTGTAPAGDSHVDGTTFELPKPTGLSKEGFHFTAWNDGTKDYAPGATYTMPEKDVTFTAQWEEDEPVIETYAVTFSAGEGTGTAPTGGSYAEGATFELPDATGLTKEGFHFTVWNDGTADYAAGATYTMPATEVTFIAQWEEDVVMYTVTFEPNNEGATWTEQIEDGKTVAKPATDPTIASGKLFRYWTTEDGVEYSFNTPITADLTLYASYAYKVTFDAGEGTGMIEPVWKTMWTPMGITLPDGTGLTHSEGKVFGGWTDGTTTYQAGERFVGTGNHTLTAVWQNAAAEITVSFETTRYGEGTPPASITGKHAGDTVTLPENTFTAKSDYVGYVFKGWYVQGGSNTVTYQPGDTYTISSDYAGDTLVFMAKWDKGDFTITYKPGDHATGADIVKNVKGGKNFLLASSEISFTPESNYTFAGWAKEGETAIIDTYMIGEDTVFVAQWSHVYVGYDNAGTAQIWLYFDTNDGMLYISGEAEDGSQDVYLSLTLTLNGTAITITPEGCAPANGTLDNNGLAVTLTYGGKTYTFGQVAPQPVEPTVTFSAGGGSGVAPTATATYNATSGMYKIELPANTYTAPEGKEFKCWSIGGQEYKAGTSYMANSGESITITAVWKETAPAFEGTVFVGNCTTPQKGGFLPSGGETYVKLIISTDKTKVQYTLSDGTVKEANLTDESSSTYKPAIYGSDALYYSVMMTNTAYYLLVKADMSKLSICDNNDELLENGEFTAETGETSGYANVALKDLAGKNFVLSGDATEIYNGYTTIAISVYNSTSFKLKLSKTGSTLGRSFMTDADTYELSGTTFTATYSASGQVMTFAFKKVGDTYQMILLSIKDSSGTELMTAPVTLVEKTA